jgi:hypothetical protein
MADSEDQEPESAPIAWNPLTPGGVASYANAPLTQLLFTQALAAFVVFAATLFYLHRAWTPVLNSAVERFPSGAELSGQSLYMPGVHPLVLGENRLLSATWVTNDALTPDADIELRLGRDEWSTGSLLGYIALPYPPYLELNLARENSAPKWGAWRSAAVPGLAAAVALSMWLAWIAMAAFYAWPIRVVVFFRDKLTSRLGSWKLCAAALLPAAVFMSSAIVLYTLGKIPVAGLLIAFAAHFVIGWFYIVAGAIALPVIPEAELLKGNPFIKGKKKKAGKKKNPFGGKR